MIEILLSHCCVVQSFAVSFFFFSLLKVPELQPVNIVETRSIMPSEPIRQPRITLPGGLQVYGAHPSVFCSTMNTVPATGSLLNKIKLPFAIHIHPYKDMNKQVGFLFGSF